MKTTSQHQQDAFAFNENPQRLHFCVSYNHASKSTLPIAIKVNLRSASGKSSLPFVPQHHHLIQFHPHSETAIFDIKKFETTTIG
jgi:hypothetical protein